MNLKFISRKTHGIIDWLTVPILAVVPRVLGFDRKVTRLHDIVAGGIAASATFTDYPAGVVKLMPMKYHLRLDKMNGALFLASAAIMTDEPASTRMCVASSGLFLLVQGFCTRTREQEKAPHRGAYARQEPILQYAERTRPDIYSSRARAEAARSEVGTR